jgi:hypothetical protein
MKPNLSNDHNLIFNGAAKVFKYFLLTLFGFVMFGVLSHVFGLALIVQMLLSESVWKCFLRMAVFIFCLFAIAMIWESWQ